MKAAIAKFYLQLWRLFNLPKQFQMLQTKDKENKGVEMDRRTLITAGLAATSLSSISAPVFAEDKIYARRFMQVWREMDRKYCYFAENCVDWNKVQQIYLPQVEACSTETQFLDIMDAVMRETCDSHTHLNNSNAGTPRWPPFDLYVESEAGKCIIKAVHEYSAAKVVGLTAGMEILEINGVSIDNRLQELRPRALISTTQTIATYLLNLVVAGTKGNDRRLLVRSGAGEKEYLLTRYSGLRPPNFESKIIEGNIGYIAIRTFANDANIIELFDAALESMKDTRALILDVRYNGGGDTAIARPIMGRFIDAKKPYAKMAKRKGKGLSQKWIEYVEPRGLFEYNGEVAILCNHWSASMAEGFPMGMRAIRNAKIIGTKMMGLGAAVYSSRAGGMDFQYSAEPVFDVNDNPRNDFIPDIIMNDGDDYITKAISVLV